MRRDVSRLALTLAAAGAMAFAEKGMLSTASIHVDLFRPATGAYLDVVGQVVRKGRRIIFAEAEMRDDQGRVVARGRQTAVPLA